MSKKTTPKKPGWRAREEGDKRQRVTLTLDPIILPQARARWGRGLGRKIDELLRRELLSRRS